MTFFFQNSLTLALMKPLLRSLIPISQTVPSELKLAHVCLKLFMPPAVFFRVASLASLLFFTVYQRYPCLCCHLEWAHFVNDLKIGNNDSSSLLADIVRLAEWSVANHLSFNAQKVYHVGYFDPIRPHQKMLGT